MLIWIFIAFAFGLLVAVSVLCFFAFCWVHVVPELDCAALFSLHQNVVGCSHQVDVDMGIHRFWFWLLVVVLFCDSFSFFVESLLCLISSALRCFRCIRVLSLLGENLRINKSICTDAVSFAPQVALCEEAGSLEHAVGLEHKSKVMEKEVDSRILCKTELRMKHD